MQRTFQIFNNLSRKKRNEIIQKERKYFIAENFRIVISRSMLDLLFLLTLGLF